MPSPKPKRPKAGSPVRQRGKRTSSSAGVSKARMALAAERASPPADRQKLQASPPMKGTATGNDRASGEPRPRPRQVSFTQDTNSPKNSPTNSPKNSPKNSPRTRSSSPEDSPTNSPKNSPRSSLNPDVAEAAPSSARSPEAMGTASTFKAAQSTRSPEAMGTSSTNKAAPSTRSPEAMGTSSTSKAASRSARSPEAMGIAATSKEKRQDEVEMSMGCTPSGRSRFRFDSEVTENEAEVVGGTTSSSTAKLSGVAGNIKVAVRVRPFNKMELEQNSGQCVSVDGSTLDVSHPQLPAEQRSFRFDACFNSFDEEDPDFVDQDTMTSELAEPLLDACVDGYNTCIFAYGQTGSGKTFSMLGSQAKPGVLPRVAEDIFVRLDAAVQGGGSYSAALSYIEIYNEQLRDLLATQEERQNTKLEIHSHAVRGVFVRGLKEVPVFDKEGIMNWLDFGMKARSVGATMMNAESSRSHCICILELHRKHSGMLVRSKVNLVDLAGSERSSKTKAAGDRLKEGNAINQSLSTLAVVISKLSETQRRRGSKGAVIAKSTGATNASAEEFIPFRSSKLTYLLRDSLSGNSKTVMLAALSPASPNYQETLSTCRFAESVKKVVTKASKNSESQGTVVETLKRECDELRRMIKEKEQEATERDAAVIESKNYQDALVQVEQQLRQAREELEANQALIEKFNINIEKQHELADTLERGRRRSLAGSGLTTIGLADTLGMDPNMPQLVSMHFDPHLCGCLQYFLTKGKPLKVGSSREECQIVLAGVGVEPVTAIINNDDDLILKIRPVQGRVLLNGKLLKKSEESVELKDSDRLIFGYAYCFRVTIPRSADEYGNTGLNEAFENALNEIGHESAESCGNFLAHVEAYSERSGVTKALVYFKKLRKLMPLVEEANAITKVLRPVSRYEWSIEALTDVFNEEYHEPDCMVRLKQYFTGAARLRNTIRKQILRKGLFEKTMNELTAGGTTASLSGLEPSKTVLLLTLDEFRERLEWMRELVWQRQSGICVDSWPGHDPYAKIGPAAEAAYVVQLPQLPQQPPQQHQLMPNTGSSLGPKEWSDLSFDGAAGQVDRMQEELDDSRALVRQLENRLRVTDVPPVQPAWAPRGLPGHIQAQLARINMLEKSCAESQRELFGKAFVPASQQSVPRLQIKGMEEVAASHAAGA